MGMDSNNCWLGNYCQDFASGGCPATGGVIMSCYDRSRNNDNFDEEGTNDTIWHCFMFRFWQQRLRKQRLQRLWFWLWLLLWTLHHGLIFLNLDISSFECCSGDISISFVCCSGVQRHRDPLRRWYGLGGVLVRQLLYQPGFKHSILILHCFCSLLNNWMASFLWHIIGDKNASDVSN